MAAPNGTTWGGIAGGYGRVGIYVGVSSNATTTTVTVSTWFWSKYSVSDGYYSYYYNNDATSATTLINRSESIKTTVDTGTGWSTSNQVKLGETTYTYSRGTSDVTRNCAVKLTNIDRVGAAMTHTRSYTIPKLASYTISYNANGGSGAPGNQTKWYGKNLTLSSTKPTRTGYSFQGWALTKANADAGTWYYSAGGTCGKDENLTLYATWKANTYTVKYDANGGTGAPGNQTKTYGVTLKLSTTKPTRTNYNFLGWGTSASATTPTYPAGANYTANSGATLYAVWELAYLKPRITNFFVSRYSYEYDEEDNVVSEGVSDEGTHALIKFDWACDRELSSIVVDWSSTVGDSGSVSLEASGTSGSVNEVIGEGTLSSDYTYTIRVTVTDSIDHSVDKRTLNGAIFAMDALPNNEGVAFGKPAERKGYLESKFKAHFLDDLTYDIQIHHANVDEMLVSGKYYLGINAINRPIERNGWLEVQCYGNGDYCYQKFIAYTGEKYERWRNEGIWGSWIFIDYIVDEGSVSGSGLTWVYEIYKSGKKHIKATGLYTIPANSFTLPLASMYFTPTINIPFPDDKLKFNTTLEHGQVTVFDNWTLWSAKVWAGSVDIRFIRPTQYAQSYAVSISIEAEGK